MNAELTNIQAEGSPVTRRNIVLVYLFIFLSCPTISFGRQDEPAIIPPPVIFSELYPCSACHKPNGKEPGGGGKSFHASIRVEGHTERDYGCFGCHDKENLDIFRLFNGSTIDLALSSELCGQCHTSLYNLWQTGLHGKVTGKWDGPKSITSCTTCHDPHQPGYRSEVPGPPPTSPEQTLRWRK